MGAGQSQGSARDVGTGAAAARTEVADREVFYHLTAAEASPCSNSRFWNVVRMTSIVWSMPPKEATYFQSVREFHVADPAAGGALRQRAMHMQIGWRHSEGGWIGAVALRGRGRPLVKKQAEAFATSARIRRRYVFCLLSAVRILHDRGVVHNDIHPDNFLIDDATRTLFLTNFDKAKFKGDPDFEALHSHRADLEKAVARMANIDGYVEMLASKHTPPAPPLARLRAIFAQREEHLAEARRIVAIVYPGLRGGAFFFDTLRERARAPASDNVQAQEAEFFEDIPEQLWSILCTLFMLRSPVEHAALDSLPAVVAPYVPVEDILAVYFAWYSWQDILDRFETRAD